MPDISLIKRDSDNVITPNRDSDHGIQLKQEGKPVDGVAQSKKRRIYLLLDHSGSMEYADKLSQAKAGILEYARAAVREGNAVGLITFSSRAKHLCEPQRNIESLEAKLRGVHAGGSTNMPAAIRLATEKLMRELGERAIVLVTDGMPCNSSGSPTTEETLKEAENAKDSRIVIYTIGTDDADRGFLEQLASKEQFAKKVANTDFRKTIADTAKMLPPGPA